jgi:hypothetical protein
MADLFLDFLRSLHIVFHSDLLVTFPPAVYEGSFFPTSSPTFVVGSVLDGSNSNRSEVES